MPKEMSATEAKTRFGNALKWTKEHQDAVIIRVHGAPEAVLIPYTTYQEIEELRLRQRKQEALAALQQLRAEIQAAGDLSDAEAYKLAGISDRVAAKILRRDAEKQEPAT